jgi:hypothetical protein
VLATEGTNSCALGLRTDEPFLATLDGMSGLVETGLSSVVAVAGFVSPACSGCCTVPDFCFWFRDARLLRTPVFSSPCWGWVESSMFLVMFAGFF